MSANSHGDLTIETPQEFATRMNIRFSNYALLDRALTHRSYLNENPDVLEDNERLEFLGDAVLDFLVGAWLFHNYPEMAEGDLTRHRSALVRTERLAEFARSINLGTALRLGRGEGQGGGRNRQVLLCGAFEAFVGALYLDQGMAAVQQFIEPLIGPAAVKVIDTRQDRDPKSQLQEIVQSQGLASPVYRTTATSGPEHHKSFEVQVEIDGVVMGFGQGHSKRIASKSAAQDALQRMGFGE